VSSPKLAFTTHGYLISSTVKGSPETEKIILTLLRLSWLKSLKTDILWEISQDKCFFIQHIADKAHFVASVIEKLEKLSLFPSTHETKLYVYRKITVD